MKDFVSKVITALRDYYGDDAEVDTKEVLKNNNQHITGVTVKFDSNISPVIYLEPYYAEYESGMDFDLVIEKIIDKVEANRELECMDTKDLRDTLMDYERCKKQIYPVLLSTERNQELLEQLVSKPLLDLSVIYVVRLGEQDDGMATVKVTKSLFDMWKLGDVDVLHHAAVNNMRTDDYNVQDLASVLANMLGEDNLDMLESQPGPKLMVMSNRSKLYSAAGVLDSAFMDESTQGKRFYMIPSSVHEWLMIPDTGDIDVKELTEMIRDVNATSVSADEILSDHPYVYDGELKCA